MFGKYYINQDLLRGHLWTLKVGASFSISVCSFD